MDIDAELEAFIREHDIHVSVEEVFHLSPTPEQVGDLRQHNHVVVRTARSKHALTVCMTSLNWDDFPVEPPHVLLALATDAAILEESDENYYAWVASLEWNPDSRAAERKFRQTTAMVESFRRLLGEPAYRALLELQERAAAEFGIEEDTEDDWEDEDGDR